jgi:phosphonate transport system ATP-binding protein
MLRVEHLTKIYENGTLALDDVSFEVPDGQFLGVIGLSGSGKSTLLRCINRLIEPTEGRILWNDVDITTAGQEDLRRIRRRIGMVFQHFNLVDRSRVVTNVMAGRLGYTNPSLSLLNRFSSADQVKAQESLSRVGLADKARSLASELSGGQQQRVGIARALMQDPEIVLADEPVASLDPVLAHSIMQHLESINRDDGVTVVCSALFNGKLVFDGPPHEIDDARFKEIYGHEAERVG